MQVTLHIGMHKTATKSLQGTLNRFSAELEARGVEVFHHLNSMISGTKNFVPGEAEAKVAAAAARGTNHLILTSESYSARSRKEFDQIWNCVAGYPVRLVLCVRHWSTFLPSRWQQNCKRRDSASFAAFLRKMMAEGQTCSAVRYDRILETCDISRFDQVRVVSFENAVANGGIVPTMLQAMDLDMLSGPMLTRAHTNAGLSNDVIDKLRLFNAIFADQSGLARNEMWNIGMPRGIDPIKFDLNAEKEPLFEALGAQNQTLDEMIAATRSEIELDAGMFQSFATPVEKAIAPFLTNPVQGLAFPDPKTAVVRSSTLEADDLPSGLQQDMRKALHAIAR